MLTTYARERGTPPHTDTYRRTRTVHILVVEDERRLANLLRRVLGEERHTVDVAYDGTSGFDLAGSDT